MKQDETEKLQEVPEDPPKKIPRVLPTSREEYNFQKYIDKKIEYTPSAFSISLEEKKQEQEEKNPEIKPLTPPEQEQNQYKSVTIFDFLTMIPVILTVVSLGWHLTLQEVFPLVHSIIDFVLILYHSLWILLFIVGDKLEDTETMLLVTSIVLEIAMLGKYGDMSHSYLQCMFSVPLMLMLLIIFVMLEESTGKRGKFIIAFGKFLWLGLIVFVLWRRAQNFRWIGFCQLLGIFLTSLSPALSSKKVAVGDKCFMIFSVMAMLGVILGFGA